MALAVRRIVVDTNLLVPSLYNETPLAIRILSGEFLLCLCPDISIEVREKIDDLAGKPFLKDAPFQPYEVHAVFDLLEEVSRNEGIYVGPCPSGYEDTLEDEEDRCFLWAAYMTGAKFLSTGDGVLLDRGKHYGTTICKLNEFWRILDQEQELAGSE